MVEGIKTHFEKNRHRYYVISIIGIAGITCLIMKKQPRPLWGGVEPSPNAGIANTASFSFARQSINIVNVLERDGRGHPGWPVQNLETKQVFFSQKSAAEAFDIGEGTLSSHLKGKFPDADGLHFQRVNLVPA